MATPDSLDLSWLKEAKHPRFIRTVPPAMPLADRQIAIAFEPNRDGFLICSQEFQGNLDEGTGYYRNISCVMATSPSDLFKIAMDLLGESKRAHANLMADFAEIDRKRKVPPAKIISGPKVK